MHWRLTKSSATGSVGTGRVEVFPTNPERAARMQIAPGQANIWEFAAVHPRPAQSATPEEINSRERDLICRYRQTELDCFAFQLDWQLLPASGPFALGTELWLSVQTDFLDTQPELEVACHSSGNQTWRVLGHQDLCDESPSGEPTDRGPAALVCHGQTSGGQSLSGLWLIEPTDQRHAQLRSSLGDSSHFVRLFGHFMEKGVIRRGRMRFWLSEQELSDADIATAYRQFAASPLPLTA